MKGVASRIMAMEKYFNKIPFPVIPVLIFFLISGGQAVSQDDNHEKQDKKKQQVKKEKGFDPAKLVPGGDIAFWSDRNGTYFYISPSLGYRVTEKFTPGLKFTYMYISDNYYNYSTNIYAGSVFGSYKIYRNLMLYAEYEVLNRDVYDNVFKDVRRRNVESLLVGGGYSQPLGGNSFMNLLILWNLLDSPYSPYANPVIRMGFAIGL